LVINSYLKYASIFLQSKFLPTKRGVQIPQEHREIKQIHSTFFNTTFTLTKYRALIFQEHIHTKIKIHHPSKTFILTKSRAIVLSGHL